MPQNDLMFFKGGHEHFQFPTMHTRDFKKAFVTISSSAFVYPFEALGGWSSHIIEHVFLPLGIGENYMWLLDYVLKSFWFVFLVVVVLQFAFS